MNLLWIVVVVLIILAVVGSPQLGVYNHGYGYYPSGGIGLIVLVLIVLLVLGRL